MQIKDAWVSNVSSICPMLENTRPHFKNASVFRVFLLVSQTPRMVYSSSSFSCLAMSVLIKVTLAPVSIEIDLGILLTVLAKYNPLVHFHSIETRLGHS
ncbi:hypothetical protein TNIN_192571 [Trichonephila inaurata madagascariensis]|uniref:Uncharacterized protein n=1 Tax=Trichonephila inaurata madagascariensis TaxID=2747483 RepID=A0A8X6Y234_9ARAC|nr:hypothetical protein TNIN_192571 [Trichonephila inaurata madagascariensis]